MKFQVKLFLFVAFLTFLIPRVAYASDYISDAVKALQDTTVYIAPGTEGTDSDTAGKLLTILRGGDDVVLVMLPEEAGSGTDINSLARSLSEKLGNQKIIGLAVGREVIGYGPSLPVGIASDKMKRADSVSNDSVTALITFAQNVHSWEVNNPLPTPIPTPRPTLAPIKLPKVSDVPWPIWPFLFVCLLVVAILFVRNEMKNRLRKKIEKIQQNVNKIRNSQVREDLTNACQAAVGLLELLEQDNQPKGYTGAKFPALLSNMDKQVVAYIRHESGQRPLPSDFLKQLKEVLLNYDALFAKLQRNDPGSVELLTSIMDSNTTMISNLGYLSEE